MLRWFFCVLMLTALPVKPVSRVFGVLPNVLVSRRIFAFLTQAVFSRIRE